MKIPAYYITGAFILLLLTAIIYPRQEPKEILLSFDTEEADGNKTGLILDMLDKKDITATFFVTGKYAELYPDIVRRISEKHEVACHSYDHPHFSEITRQEKEEQLDKCISIIKKITGKRPTGFRAPYHDIDKETIEVLKEKGFKYDASTIENYGIFFPDIKMTEIKISSYGIFPMSDVILRYYLKMPKQAYLYLMTRIKKQKVSLSFHPHHAVRVLDEIGKMISHYKNTGAEFKTHEEYIR